MIFSTVRPCRPTLKSHISHVVLDAEVWEGSAAFELEAAAAKGIVVSYARNDHLGFTIPYEFEDKPHSYTPDFLVKLANGLTLIVEIKGYETEQDRQKHTAAARWVSAVNNAGRWGKWGFTVCKETAALPEVLADFTRG